MNKIERDIVKYLNFVSVFSYVIIADGEIRSTGSGLNTEFTFDLFICVAILRLHCSIMSEEKDAASVYGFLNRCAQKT